MDASLSPLLQPLLQRITPEEVAGYLERSGWQVWAKMHWFTRWRSPSGVLLDVGDGFEFHASPGRSLPEIGAAESRPWTAVLEDIAPEVAGEVMRVMFPRSSAPLPDEFELPLPESIPVRVRIEAVEEGQFWYRDED